MTLASSSTADGCHTGVWGAAAAGLGFRVKARSGNEGMGLQGLGYGVKNYFSWYPFPAAGNGYLEK